MKRSVSQQVLSTLCYLPQPEAPAPVPGACPQEPRGPYLGENVGALLQERHWRVADVGGQLNPEQLLLLGGIPL